MFYLFFYSFIFFKLQRQFWNDTSSTVLKQRFSYSYQSEFIHTSFVWYEKICSIKYRVSAVVLLQKCYKLLKVIFSIEQPVYYYLANAEINSASTCIRFPYTFYSFSIIYGFLFSIRNTGKTNLIFNRLVFVINLELHMENQKYTNYSKTIKDKPNIGPYIIYIRLVRQYYTGWSV